MPQTRKSDKIAKSGADVHINEAKRKEIRYEDVELKLYKEPISAEELAVYLSRQKNIADGNLSEKSIRRYIEQLCKMSRGLLKVSDFKDGTKSNSKYVFKPQYHGLLLAFLDTEYFGGKKKDDRLSDRTILHEQLAENVSKYLDKNMQKKIKEDPSYLNALLEGRLSKRITKELAGLLNTMYNSEPVMRYQFMIECLDRLVTLRRWMNEWNVRMRLIRDMFAEEHIENIQQGEQKEDPFQYDMLDSLMIKLIAAKVHNKDYEYVAEDEEISYPTAYMATKLYDITGKEDNEIYAVLSALEKNVSNYVRYQVIMYKAHCILNEKDHLERKILESLDKIVKALIVSNETDVSPNDFNRLTRFTEDSVRDDKIAIKELLGDSMADITLDKQTIEEIMAIKDRNRSDI